MQVDANDSQNRVIKLSLTLATFYKNPEGSTAQCLQISQSKATPSVTASSARTVKCLRVLSVFVLIGYFLFFFVWVFCAFPFSRESNRSKVSLHHKKEEPLSLFNPLCEYILENTAFIFPKGIISKRQRQRGL